MPNFQLRGPDGVLSTQPPPSTPTVRNRAFRLVVASVKWAGASGVYAAITHPVLSGPALKRISESVIEKLIVTDTIPLGSEASDHKKLHVVSVARMIGEAIRRINNEESVSGLF